MGSQGRKHVIAHEFFADIFRTDLFGTGLVRFVGDGFEVFFLAHIGRKGDDRALLRFQEPT